MHPQHAHYQNLLHHHPALRLLRKESAPLVLTFLQSAFRDARRSRYGARRLTTLLEDLLFALNGGDAATTPGAPYPRPARTYLERWTAEGLLRNFYDRSGGEADETTFELTAAGEQALQWFAELAKPEFIGAESRLRQVYDLLRELAEGTTDDVDARRRQLEGRRADIDAQLAALDRGELPTLGGTGIRERFQLIEETAQRLLSDFRTIEDNFRRLNATARQELVRRHASRGEVLADIFDHRATILDSDQGRTFRAFWEFLIDQGRRDEQEGFITRILDLPELTTERDRSFLPRLEMSLTEAGDRVNQTTNLLVEQLRRFVQSQGYAETRRVTGLIEDIERLVLEVKADPPTGREFATIGGGAEVNLPMDRGPFTPPLQLDLDAGVPAVGDADAVVTDALYQLHYVDPAELRGRIDTLLRNRTQISLREITEEIPVRRGLTELLVYFNIATEREAGRRATINPARKQDIPYPTGAGVRTASFPETIFLNA